MPGKKRPTLCLCGWLVIGPNIINFSELRIELIYECHRAFSGCSGVLSLLLNLFPLDAVFPTIEAAML